jgi:hypothetical protein
MNWSVSIFTANRKRLIFAAQANRDEAGELVAEARRLNSSVRIFLRSPTGQVEEISKLSPASTFARGSSRAAGR